MGVSWVLGGNDDQHSEFRIRGFGAAAPQNPEFRIQNSSLPRLRPRVRVQNSEFAASNPPDNSARAPPQNSEFRIHDFAAGGDLRILSLRIQTSEFNKVSAATLCARRRVQNSEFGEAVSPRLMIRTEFRIQNLRGGP